MIHAFYLKEVVSERYEVRERLVTNSVGEAYLARDRRRSRDVQLRVALPAENTAQLLDEAQRIAQHPHPGIPAILDVSAHGDTRFVVGEHVVGTTLASRISQSAESGGLELDLALSILIELCEVLSIVHRLDLEHDALAPDRILLDSDGRVVLDGVGAIRVGRELASDSPYATTAESVRVRDCYALGVIAFEVLTGAVPVPWKPLASQIVKMSETHAPLRGTISALVSVADGRALPDLEEVLAALRSARAALRPLSVIIAESDRGARKLLALVLREISPGSMLRFCSDGVALEQLAFMQPPELVFFDPELPRTDARELCTKLRGLASGPAMMICATRTTARARLVGLDVPSIDLTPRASRTELATALREILRRRARPESVREPARSRAASRQHVRPEPVVGELAPGMVLAGRYVIEGRLGEGGMGGVYAARHVDLGKQFALKTLRPGPGDLREARRRFLDEAKIASQISHPNIVSVVDFGQDLERGVFLVMELLSGSTLGQLAGRLSLRKTCEVLGQVADALDVLHKSGIVHGDIKSDNVMLVEEQLGPRRRSIARLIDFGLAARLAALDTTAPISGTPEYLAPERALGGLLSAATDIYALGVLAYELLAGSLPFQGRIDDVIDAHLRAEPPPIAPQRGEQLDEAVLALVARAMHKDPAQRHPTVSAFRYELNTVMSMLGMVKRTQRIKRDPTAAQLFVESRLAQAVIAQTGDLELANDAFRALAVDLAQLEFERTSLAEAIARAHDGGVPVASLARQGTRELLLVMTPFETGTHVLVSDRP